MIYWSGECSKYQPVMEAVISCIHAVCFFIYFLCRGPQSLLHANKECTAKLKGNTHINT